MAQNAIDYSDIFCQAVQNIVDGAVSNLEFDISRECSVIDIIDRSHRKYRVSDGSTSFEAVATEGSSYEIGNRVMVTIPQGKSNSQIIILNKIMDEWSGPSGFVRPLNTITACTGNIAFNDSSEKKLLANSKETKVNILTLKNQRFLGFQKIGVAAKFKSLLDNLNIISGDYGLIFTLVQYSNNGDIPDRVDQHIFSCLDMLGNPYAFNSFFEQEYAFSIDKDMGQINELIVDFYQDENFIDGNNNKLDFSSFGKNHYNLFVKDLEIYLGYPQDKEIEEIVEIVSDNLEYTGSSNETRDIHIQWIHRIDEYTLENITHQKYYNSDNIYEIRWYQYTFKCPDANTDEYGGKHWELLNKTKPDAAWDNYPFTFTVSVRPTYEEEKIKAVCLVKTYPLINDPTYEQIEKFTSNILTFENSKDFTEDSEAPPGETLKKNLSLHFHDNSSGNYFLYDQNGLLIDMANQGQSHPRKIEVFYDGEPLNANYNWFNSVEAITWEVPAPNQNSSMIYYNKSEQGFIEPNKDFLEKERNWQKVYKSSDTTDFKNGGTINYINNSENKKYLKIPVSLKENEETYSIIDITNSINGKFNLTSKIASSLSIKDKDDSLISIEDRMAINVKMSVWIWSEEKSKWVLIRNLYKSVDVLNGEYQEASELNGKLIEGIFSVAQKHEKIRIGIGLSPKQGNAFNKILEDNKDNEISWNLYIADETSFTVQSEFYTNTNYPTKDENGNTTNLNTVFTYSILDSWDRNRNNNTIRCKVTVDKKDYILQEELRFGPKGSNGTNNTFILEMLDGKNALTTTSDTTVESIFDTLRVEAILIRGNGNRYYFTDEQANAITWELIHQNANHIEMGTAAGAIKLLNLKINTVPENNYAILKASVKYEDSTLEAYLPIPIKHYTCSGMSGPKQIIYNHQSVPQVGNDVYIAYKNNEDQSETEEMYNGWSLTQPKTTTADGKEIEANPNPVKLKTTGHPNGGVTLAAAPLYSKKVGMDGPIYDSACVYYKESSEKPILWSQPILIMQSNYDFSMLNQWDGSLTIDKENGTILSTMLGAGKKNGNNQFSGVLLGDVQKGTNLNDMHPETGVYGFKDGIITYALKEDGTGYFGAQGRGRIEFDGTKGRIQSAGWIEGADGWELSANTASGTLLDLDDGMLLIQGNDNNYFKFNENGSGGLLMSLSGANITLTDKTSPSLSGYIDVTAKNLVSEFRRGATYTVTCNTGGEIKNNAGQHVGYKHILNIADFRQYDLKFVSDNAGENGWSTLSTNDILKNGVVIAVTFTNEQKITSTILKIKEKIVESENSTETHIVGYCEKKTGEALYLNIGDQLRPIYVNDKATNAISSITSEDIGVLDKIAKDESLTVKDFKKIKNNENSNPYGWSANTTIYFTYHEKSNDKGEDISYWEVSDGGNYSRITQTTDKIRSEVSTIGGNLNSSITQTANSIKMEVQKKASYYCTCNTDNGTLTKEIMGFPNNVISSSSSDNPSGIVMGCIITIRFNKEEKTGATKFKINGKEYGVLGAPTWNSGETLSFIYDNEKWAMTSTSNASIDIRDNEIISEVRRQGGYSCIAKKTGNGIYELTIKAIKATDGTSYTWSELEVNNTVIVVTFENGNSYEGPIKFISSTSKDVYTHDNEITSKENPLFWDPNAMLYFIYDSSTGGWRVVDSGAYSKIDQTADKIRLEVSDTLGSYSTLDQTAAALSGYVQKTTPEGEIDGFTWSLDADGFYLNNGTIANTDNYKFKCNSQGLSINGNGSFSGNLTAEETTFKTLRTGTFTIPSEMPGIAEEEWSSVFSAGSVRIAAKSDDGSRAGLIVLTSNPRSGVDDVTIYAKRLLGPSGNYGGYGNLGYDNHPWDMSYIQEMKSVRDLKNNIEVYNIDQAYEELKHLPLYTYRYIGDGDSSRTSFLGSMIDYLPNEVTRITARNDGSYLEPISLTYWNIAASQVMQNKIEMLELELQNLKERMLEYGIN